MEEAVKEGGGGGNEEGSTSPSSPVVSPCRRTQQLTGGRGERWQERWRKKGRV